MKPDEYLEKVLADSYKREIDQEENVARAMPFFAAALAVLATILGMVRQSIPAADYSLRSIVIWIALAGVAFGVLMVLYFLTCAVWPRSFIYLMRDDELVDYADKLKGYYGRSKLTAKEVEEAITRDIRENLVQQYAICAVNNRNINNGRVLARGRASISLLSALLSAFILIALLILADGTGTPADARKAAGSSRGSPSTKEYNGQARESSSKAAAPADANGAKRRVAPTRTENSTNGEDIGGAMTKDKTETVPGAGNSGNHQQTSEKPAAPSPQHFQKNADPEDIKK